jgi:hypothetical protein
VELVADDIRATLLENCAWYRQDPDFDPMPVVKFFTPDASATWPIVSADPEDPFVLFGLCRVQHNPNWIKPLRDHRAARRACADGVVLIASSVALIMCAQQAPTASAWSGCLQPIHPTKELVMTHLRQRMSEYMELRNVALNTQLSYLQQVSLFARHFGKSPDLLG